MNNQYEAKHRDFRIYQLVKEISIDNGFTKYNFLVGSRKGKSDMSSFPQTVKNS